MGTRAKYPDRSAGEVTVAAAVTVLPFNPIVFGDVNKWSTAQSVMPVFELEISAVVATNLTDTQLISGYLIVGAIASADIDTVDFANNELDIAAHGLESGQGPLQLTTSDTLPAGLLLLTDYWVIKTDAGTIQLALSLEDASSMSNMSFA